MSISKLTFQKDELENNSFPKLLIKRERNELKIIIYMLQNKIKTLVATFAGIAMVLSLVAVSSAEAAYTRDLSVGSTGADVSELQSTLVAGGYLVMPVGVPMGYFGSLTQSAVAKWQAAVGVSPAVGYFGPISRAKIGGAIVDASLPAGCTSAAGYSPTTGTKCDTGGSTVPGCSFGALFSSTTGASCTGGSTPTPDNDLQGGAGSIESYTAISGLTNEEVGEDAEDVAVAGLEIEAGEDSDIEIRAVKVVFNEGTANQDFDEYASEVSIWLGDEVFARVDASDFKDVTGTANDWTKTISLDSGAIVRSGETEDLEVRVTGISNLDSSDAGDTWTVDFTSVRFRDATGVTISEDPGMTPISFSFDTFATANDVEMKTNLATDNPEEGIVVIDSEGSDVPLLKFKIKADGSDITLKEIPVALTGVNLTDIDLAIDELVLDWGDDSASESIPATSGTTETVTFDALDLTINDGETLTFTVIGKSATSSVESTQGITLAAVITPDNIIAEDSTGEDIVDADSSGSATGETQHVFTIVPEIKIVSKSIVQNNNGTAPAESAKATIKLEITARGGTIYLNGDNETTENLRFFVNQVYGSGNTASTTASTTVYSLSGNYTTTNSGANEEYYTVNEDDTITITLDTTISQSTVTTTAIEAGLKALLIQYGTANTSDATRSAIDLNWTDLTDKTQTGTVTLVNAS